MVRTHKIPSIGSLTESNHKNQVWLEIDRYMDQLRWEATSDDLELSIENMQKYTGGLVMFKTMLHILQYQLYKGSKTIYPEAMEERVRYQKDTIK